MPTLYIDVYFLINFTVDFLSLYFACSLISIKTSLIRLSLCSVLGGIFPCLLILFKINSVFYIPIYILWLIIVSIICPHSPDFKVILKLICAFSLIQTIFGGAVTFIFDKLDSYFFPMFSAEASSPENREILLLSAIILLVYCLLKLIRLILSSSLSKKNVFVNISVLNEELRLNALVDSGSFVKDPMDLKPVMIVKQSNLKVLIEKFGNKPITSPENPLSSRIRIIPIKGIDGERILYGFRPDFVEIEIGKKKVTRDIIIALDTEGDSFNGCDALIPLSVLT